MTRRGVPMKSLPAAFLLAVLGCCAALSSADESGIEAPFLLSPPNQDGPVVVTADFQLHDILEVDDGKETFEFSGVRTLTWRDPRQAFEPAVVGVDEKVYTGNFQFNEVSTGWYPQMVLVNEAGSFETSGVSLRVRPDGTSTLVEMITAAAEVELDLMRFPLDRHRLELVFEVLGSDSDPEEVVIEAQAATAGVLPAAGIRVSQWRITGWSVGTHRQVGPSTLDGAATVRQSPSAFIVSVDVKRDPFYVLRLVVFPLVVIVLLSFSVFWMDRSSLSDRTNVSFIGILTGVAYQMVISDTMPHISYFTLIHGFLTLSFATMCATVVVNLVVGAMDRRGERERGDQVDYRCRWMFPLTYFGLIGVMVAVTLLAY